MKRVPKEKRICIQICLSREECQEVRRGFAATTCQSLSEYGRKKLLDRTIRINNRNQSLDEFMLEMIRLRNELHGIAALFGRLSDQGKLLQEIPETRDWLRDTCLQKELLLKQTEAIKQKINSISDLWL